MEYKHTVKYLVHSLTSNYLENQKQGKGVWKVKYI
jgi:hypothetical protein